MYVLYMSGSRAAPRARTLLPSISITASFGRQLHVDAGVISTREVCVQWHQVVNTLSVAVSPSQQVIHHICSGSIASGWKTHMVGLVTLFSHTICARAPRAQPTWIIRDKPQLCSLTRRVPAARANVNPLKNISFSVSAKPNTNCSLTTKWVCECVWLMESVRPGGGVQGRS